MNRQAKLLSGWKEIALHMNRSVRCVQRWERHESLPVRRHGHAHGASVYAFCDELDGWWQDELRGSTGSPIQESSMAVKRDDAAKSLARRGGPTDLGLTAWEAAVVIYLLRRFKASIKPRSSRRSLENSRELTSLERRPKSYKLRRLSASKCDIPCLSPFDACEGFCATASSATHGASTRNSGGTVGNANRHDLEQSGGQNEKECESASLVAEWRVLLDLLAGASPSGDSECELQRFE